MTKLLLLTLAIGLLISTSAMAQTQVIKGKVLDAQADYPLIGATVTLAGSEPVKGAVTDTNGNFKIENVPVGRQTLTVQYIGYKSISVPNVLVTAGKEVVVQLKLEESVEKLDEIVITSESDKDMPLNELAKVSARTFSLEEVTRFSGGRNDVARLATSFAGVSAPDDSRNDIVVRGNSPVGLLWRVEGIPIATTNHFATQGTTGGPVNALNTNLLRTSDFLTGAFPAEYGNANAAVFDVNFRNGNKDTYEFTGQLSAFSGLEFMAEGPLSRANNSSFIASYRYGIASLAATGTTAVPYYQDFSFKLNLGETKAGRFEIFGLGGLSNIDFKGDEIENDDLFANPNEDAYVDNQLGLIGINHLIRLNKTTYIKTAFGASTNFNEYQQDNLVKNAEDVLLEKYNAVDASTRESRYTLSSTLNKKFNAKWSLKTGVLIERYDADFSVIDRDNRANIPDDDADGIPDYYVTIRNLKDTYTLSQLFAQAENKLTDNLSVTFGLHSQYLDYTDDVILEPRAAISWQMTANQRWSLAYGFHAQTVPTPVLFFEEEISSGVYERTNEDLEFIKSHHYVLAYDRNLGADWRLKTEAYYQNIFDVPVESQSGSYSVLNEGADFIFNERGSLVNDGSGKNYGIELTLEKFFSRGYYLLMTSSMYESKYKGSDGIERNTAFNNNLVANLLLGKEWAFGESKRNALTFDTKLTTAGGKPYTPVDLEATRNNAGREIRMENIAFSERYNTYFRWDVKFGVRLNSKNKNISHQFFVDLQNVTNRKNEFVRRYNEVTDHVDLVEQIGFFPDVMYRIQF
ncbi:TonB-dependent receptor [Fulvivirga ulvae]|uniref:TonB-dependent receptor n=1 Tax=Fulvivirga ulvae TaxID=2904245 RepID=UPI001F35D854|nr:TonB-dependent receptor [Fulvivirga ulvae]UII34073.1 TonB-dependent receptor [Fulvivirga ulvae]